MSKQEQSKEKLRVYEYAKSLNMSSKEIISILKRLEIPVNNHMSVMEHEAIEQVEQFFRNIKANAAAKMAEKEAAKASAAKAARERERERIIEGRDTQAQRPVRRTPADHTRSNAQTTRTRDRVQSTEQRSSREGTRSPAARPATPSRQSESTTRQRSAERRTPDRQSESEQRSSAPGGSEQRQGRAQGQGQGQAQRHSARGDSSNRGGARKDLRIPPVGGDSGRAKKVAETAPAEHERRRQANAKSSTTTGTRRPFDKSGEEENAGARGRKQKANTRFADENRSGRSRGGRHGNRGKQEPRKEKIDNTPKKIIVRGDMTVGEIAKLLHKDVSDVIKKLLLMGVVATINQELDIESIQLLAAEYKVEVEVKLPVEEDPFELEEEADDPQDLVERPPVVTIMGHVDHGKTTLLDAIRHTSVSAGEAGGITQHIGAYQVVVNQKKITFLDTPGHEAFTTMRSRGAQITDITILVVAADDGVMPQTIEAINHAKAANVPIIVAVNKVDKPEANPDRVKQELTEHALIPEEWGGDTIFVNVSAKQRTGLDELLEMILLVAEVQELKANPHKQARGTVIEAELDKGRGPVARVLIQQGTLKIGDAFIAGVCFGRIRAMVNDKGRRIKEADPSTPVEITGLTEVPLAGDPFIVFEDERKARAIAERRSTSLRQTELGSNVKVTLDDLYEHIKLGEIKDLNVIIKADVQGSAEALKESLGKIEVEGVRVKIIHAGVGAISESDIILASASNAIIIGFNVRPEVAAKAIGDQEKVDIRLHRVIYSAIEEIESAMKGMLDPEYKESVIGHAEVRETFKVSRVGTIAGCMVTSGKILRSAEARIIRDGIVIFEGKIDSLKRFKDDAREVAQGYECGITLQNFNDIKDGDTIEAFVMETVER